MTLVPSESGLTWRIARRLPNFGSKYEGCGEAGERVLIHEVWRDSEEDVERFVRAILIARREEVTSCDHLRQLIDVIRGETRLFGVYEWADASLAEATGEDQPPGQDLAQDVDGSIGAALRHLHDHGLVHCDVTPHNILRVDGEWKLADLECVVEIGTPIRGLTKLDDFRPPDVTRGDPANPSIDTYGLDAVVRWVRDQNPKPRPS